jgi:hypothetical protein
MIIRTHLLLVLLVGLLVTGCGTTTVDGTRGRSDICELHHVHMDKKKVQIIYGLMGATDFSLAYHAASTNSFPHADDVALGGCIVDTPKFALIYSCPQCEQARKKWEIEYGKKP